MTYSVLVLAYSVCVSRNHSSYMPESFPCLPALHQGISASVGRNEPHKMLALGGGWRSCCFPSCFQHPVTDVAGQEEK